MAEPITVKITNLNSPIRTAKVSNKVAESAVTSVAGRVGDILLTQADVAGLENVNNTSDLNKPISTATQAAIDLKSDIGHNHLISDITDLNINDFATSGQGALADSALQSGNNISLLNNDIGYLLSGDNVSLLANDALYTSSGDNVSLFANDVGYVTGNYQLLSEKSVAGGYASLDGGGKVPSSELPSYVDDVLEYSDFASLPVTGETGKIYVTIDDGKIYRWTGSVYVEISADAGAPVLSVNTLIGAVVLDPDDLDDSLTTNKFTTQTEIDKLSGIAPNAEVNVNADWTSVGGDSEILNKPVFGDITGSNIADFATSGQGVLADSALQSGDNVSLLVNDTGYLLSGDNISVLNNNSLYVASGDNISLLTNDAGYLTSAPTETLAETSSASTDAAKSLYTMSAGIPVEFESSDNNTLFYLDETNEHVGIGTTTPDAKLHVSGDIKIVNGTQGANKILTSDANGRLLAM
jgi:hypothetical protein